MIPARGGSKGVSRKNLADVGGKPLIAWTIECAQRAASLTSWFVSTDDEDIGQEARHFGARARRRPVELASDTATTHAVAAYCLMDYSMAFGVSFDAVMVLQPTCPLRTPVDIDGAIALMEDTGCDSVVSYAAVGPNHPARMATITDGVAHPFELGDYLFARVQDLPPVYIRSGDIYLATVETVRHGTLVGDDCRAWIIPPERHLNIDTPRDLLVARTIIGGMT